MTNTLMINLKNRLAAACSILVLSSATWHEVQSSAGMMLAAAPISSTVSTGVRGMGGGGIRVTVDKKFINADVSNVTYTMGILQGTFNNGEVLEISLSLNELSELVHIVKIDNDGMFEVSIDPVADANNSYTSPELGSSNIGWQLLILDEKIAQLLEGQYALPEQYQRSIQIPPDVARDLLLSNNPKGKDYGRLADRYITFSHSWHNTTIAVTIGKNGRPQFQVHLDPVPIFLSPDGRRVYPSGKEKKAASIPYYDLVKTFESDPESFTASVPALDSCMRYIKAFALLAAWENTSPDSWREKIDEQISACHFLESYSSVKENLRASRLGDSTNSFLQEIAMLAKQSMIGAAWREYRMSLDPEKMKPEQRIAMFIDEVVAHYSSLENHGAFVLLDTESPDSLFKLIDGIDLEDHMYKYAGWAKFAMGILGVWSGHSLDEILKCFGNADERARIDKDHALKYQILKAVENLLPVLKSNLYLDSLGKKSPKYCTMWYDPIQQNIGMTDIDPWKALRYIEDNIEIAIRNHMREEYLRMETDIEGLFNKRGQLKARTMEVARVWNSYQMSHLLDERHRIELVHTDEETNEQDPYGLLEYMDPILAQWGKIQFALGVTSYNKRDLTTSICCARMLSSIASVATQEERFATAGIIRNWQKQLVALNNIEN